MSSLATLDRRVYELISDDSAPGGDDPPASRRADAGRRRRWCWRCRCPCRRRLRRTSGRGTPGAHPGAAHGARLAAGQALPAASREPRRSTSRCPRSSRRRCSRSRATRRRVLTPWRNRIDRSRRSAREKRVFGLHKSRSAEPRAGYGPPSRSWGPSGRSVRLGQREQAARHRQLEQGERVVVRPQLAEVRDDLVADRLPGLRLSGYLGRAARHGEAVVLARRRRTSRYAASSGRRGAGPRAWGRAG